MSLNATSIIKQRESLLLPECSGENKVWLHFPSCCFPSRHPLPPTTFKRTYAPVLTVPMFQLCVISGIFAVIALVMSSKCVRKCHVHCIIQLSSLL